MVVGAAAAIVPPPVVAGPAVGFGAPTATVPPLELGPSLPAPKRRRYRLALAGAAVSLACVVTLALVVGGAWSRKRRDKDPARDTQTSVVGRRITLKGRRTLGRHAGECAVAFGGRRLVSVGIDKTIRVWDLEHLETPPHLLEAGTEMQCAALSPDGKWLAAGHVEKPRVRLWDLDARQRGGTIDTLGGGTWGLAFHPSGKQLAVGTATQLLLFDLNDQCQQIKTRLLLKNRYVVGALGFSTDGKRLAAAAYSTDAHVWDTATLKEISATSVGEELRGADLRGRPPGHFGQ